MIKEVKSTNDCVHIIYENKGKYYEVDVIPKDGTVLLHFSCVVVNGVEKHYHNGAQVNVNGIVYDTRD